MSQHPIIPPESGQAETERIRRAFHRLLKYYKALDCGHFRPVEMTLVRHIIERGWFHPIVTCGLSEARPVLISCAVLNTMYRAYHENDFRRALATLRGRRVLLLQEDGGYLVNRDYRDWRDRNGNPLLSASDLATVEASIPGKPSLAVVGEFPEGRTSNLSAPVADAAETILDDSEGASAGDCSEPSDQAPALAPAPSDQAPALAEPSDQAPALAEPSDHRNGTIERAPRPRFVDKDLSSSSLHSYRNSQPFSSSDIYKSSVMEDTTGNPDTYIYQKKDDLANSTDRNGYKSASMLPVSREAFPTVQANPVPSLESSPAAPSTNGIMPASMLEEIPGPESPDDALWVELKYMCNRFFPGCDFDLQFARWRRVFPTAVMVGAFKRCFVKNIIGKHNIMHAFSYVLKVMQSWNGPGIEAGFDRDMNRIPVEVPGSLPAAPASEPTNVDPYAEFRANHSPAMLLEWMKDNNVSMENNPPKKGSPNGKIMDDDDYNRRMSIRARDPDRFRKLAMGKYCPSLILESES
jgi:hypothetical protein